MARQDMTQGSIAKKMISFAIPILLGQMLQQLYNVCDAWVVGKYIGKEALAAVGASGPMINMIIAFFTGMSTGASVLVSQYFGAKDGEGLGKTIHTGMVLAILLGLALSLVGVALSPWFLRAMKVSEDALPDATKYLQIYFSGLIFLTVYNMGTSTLRAMGDTRRPLYFLMLSAFINVVLNLYLVGKLGLGIEGVAWPTVFANGVSAVLVLWIMGREQGAHRFEFRKLHMDWAITRRIARIGLPSGFQQAVISGSNMIVQSYINRLGLTTMAGYTAASRLDSFVMLPSQALGMTTSTFVGQNLGARQVGRAKQGVRHALAISLGITATLSLIGMAIGPSLLGIFSKEPEVIQAGLGFMRVFLPAYVILSFTQVIPGALRGAGDVRTATSISIFSYVVLRQIYLFFVTKISHSIFTVALGYPLTWTVVAVVMILYYRKTDWSHYEKVQITA